MAQREEILVVGGRTTGLMAAAELARRDVPVRIVDKSPGIDPHIRANLLHSRTLEIFQSLGLVEAATEGSVEERGLQLFVNGTLVDETLHEPIDSPFPFGLSQSQAVTEAVLEGHLERLGVRVERSVELTALDQREDCVVATLTHPDGRREAVQAPWLIGCDGAHSTVRHLTGCAFPGDADPYPYVLADVLVDGDLEDALGYLFLHDDGEVFIFTKLPKGRRLVCANFEKGSGPAPDPTLEQMQALVDRRARSGIRLSDPQWLAHFSIHYRLAPHYRHGRTLLAGDAAHVHSLLGGQGMNTGIQDAFNLGWKLAAVYAGWAPEWWIDTYETERRKVGEDVIATTRAITDETELFAKASAEERNRIVSHLFPSAGHRQKAARHSQEVDLDYRGSRLCLSAGEDGQGPMSALLGERAPDVSELELEEKRVSILELLGRGRHLLLLFAGPNSHELVPTLEDAVADTRRHRHWVDPFLVVTDSAGLRGSGEAAVLQDPGGRLHERYGAVRPSAVLIRPDGYVSYCNDGPLDLGRRLDALLR